MEQTMMKRSQWMKISPIKSIYLNWANRGVPSGGRGGCGECDTMEIEHVVAIDIKLKQTCVKLNKLRLDIS